MGFVKCAEFRGQHAGPQNSLASTTGPSPLLRLVASRSSPTHSALSSSLSSVANRRYDTDNIPNKTQACIHHLEPTLKPRGLGNGPDHPYTLTFLSAGKFPQSPPQYMASGQESGGLGKAVAVTTSLFTSKAKRAGTEGGVNARIGKWLLQNAFEGRRPRATLMLDYYQDTGAPDGGMAELIAGLNYIDLGQ